MPWTTKKKYRKENLNRLGPQFDTQLFKISKANFSTTDADEEREDAEQRELLEAAAAMGKREDETEETAVGGGQAEEEEDVEIAEQEVSSRNVDV